MAPVHATLANLASPSFSQPPFTVSIKNRLKFKSMFDSLYQVEKYTASTANLFFRLQAFIIDYSFTLCD
jgi:hypothetical protein